VRVWCADVALWCCFLPGVAASVDVTPAPNGPYRVNGNRVLDNEGRVYVARGTELPAVTGDRSDLDGSGGAFGPLSGTALITIRQRLNMNAVRLPVLPRAYEADARYRDSVRRVVDLANQLELLVILTAGPRDSSPEFWGTIAEDFRSHQNVFFAPRSARFVAAIRSAGAEQPIAVPAAEAADLPGVIAEVAPTYADLSSAETRERMLGATAARLPVMVTGLDPRPNEDTPECAAFPRDPTEAAALVQANLDYFDRHGISWTIASFRPGSLIGEYRFFIGTKLDDGWSCGRVPSLAGLGLELLSHLWSAGAHGLFPVNGDAGGLLLPRGGITTVYGPILAERAITAPAGAPPFRLANLSVQVTDSRGVTRAARLITTGAGWSEMSFVVPHESATGEAEIRLQRSDGSVSTARTRIADVAPGLSTASADGRGVAKARFFHGINGAGGPAWACGAPSDCRALPIPLQKGLRTTLHLEGTGFRYAGAGAEIVAIAGGVRLPALSIRPMPERPGRDYLTVAIPDGLIGRGEMDLWVKVAGRLSNVVRVNFGAALPALDPLRESQALLGRYLFYDRRMSVNGSTSCATCHRHELAFTDGRAHAVGATGAPHPRSAMSLVNVAYNRLFNWSDPTVHSLEEQALKPMYATDPVELGLDVIEPQFLRLLGADPVYRRLFPQAFPGEGNPYAIPNVARAIAAFERTIVGADSPWDRFHYGDARAISESAKRGEILFFTDGGPQCFRCHSGFNFSGDDEYHNTALYDPYPPPNLGLFVHTRRVVDAGKFKAPTLRNIAMTAPYMHDGSIATLEEVLDHYAAGGRAHTNSGRDPLVRGFAMSPQNRADLVAFLKSLTDEGLLHDPRFADPWSR